MSEHAQRARPKTRQEVAAEILEKIDRLEEAMQVIPGGQWDEVLGQGIEELWNKAWAGSILRGMVQGTITVGDSRLADTLQRLEDTIRSVPDSQAEQNFKRLMGNESEVDEWVQTFKSARLQIERITENALTAGLTTPGQDLSAGQGRGLGTNVR